MQVYINTFFKIISTLILKTLQEMKIALSIFYWVDTKKFIKLLNMFAFKVFMCIHKSYTELLGHWNKLSLAAKQMKPDLKL